MDNNELNEAVAKKLGWELWQGTHWRRQTASSRPDHIDHEISSFLPDYCHSIEAAWEIVEKFPMQVGGVMRVGTWYEPLVAGRTREDLRANTAAMAICKAFLKLTPLDNSAPK